MQHDSKRFLNHYILKTVNERIKKVIFEKKISQTDFALSINVNPQTISLMFKRNTNPSFKVLFGILEKYPTIDAHWLITGKAAYQSKEGKVIVNDPVEIYERSNFLRQIDQLEELIKSKEEIIKLLKDKLKSR